MLKTKDKIDLLEDHSLNLFYLLDESRDDLPKYLSLFDTLLQVEDEIKFKKRILKFEERKSESEDLSKTQKQKEIA